MKPGTSFITRTGVFPTVSRSTIMLSMAVGDVASVRITSTSGTR